jgi:hypothetical protein
MCFELMARPLARPDRLAAISPASLWIWIWLSCWPQPQL